MKTKKSLNPQIVAPVERTTTSSPTTEKVQPAWDQQSYSISNTTVAPFSGDDAE